MPVNTRSDKFNAAVQAKVEEFKVAFIQEIQSNIRDLFKNEIRELVKEETKEIEKLSSTVAMLQKHIHTLKENNEKLKKNVMT